VAEVSSSTAISGDAHVDGVGHPVVEQRRPGGDDGGRVRGAALREADQAYRRPRRHVGGRQLAQRQPEADQRLAVGQRLLAHVPEQREGPGREVGQRALPDERGEVRRTERFDRHGARDLDHGQVLPRQRVTAPDVRRHDHDGALVCVE